MMQKRKKRSITLLEIMIVILLIGIIGSVIGYNMKGSLDAGRAFKSEQGASRIKEALLLEVAKGNSIDQVIENPKDYLSDSGLIKDVDKLLKDGWDEAYTISRDGEEIVVSSKKLMAYEEAKKAKHAKK